MSDFLAPLIADFLDWLDREPRTYAEVMDAWRTSCPRLTVWEDAMDRGLIRRERHHGETFVVVTEPGREFSSRKRAISANNVTG